jgi:hypothetical protein
MRMTRVRFTVRQLMIAAAVVAVLMAAEVWLQRRTAHLKRLSRMEGVRSGFRFRMLSPVCLSINIEPIVGWPSGRFPELTP